MKMEMKRCMCGLCIEKSERWNFDLDVCIHCADGVGRREKILEYADTFENGDLIVARGIDCILVDKSDPNRWIVVEIATGARRAYYVGNFIEFGSVRELREVIYKRTKNDQN